ncbi:MAG: hypothetical protein EBZ61_03990, partial [Micrococcales bacterium]|nr:hypothetical protein [Micrococcales bacterium]
MSYLISRLSKSAILAVVALVLSMVQIPGSYASGTGTSLKTFTVNGQSVSDGSSVSLAVGTTSVDVVAEPADVEATATVTGASELVPGDNPLTVTVTKQGSSPTVYNVNLSVMSLSSDTSLKSWKVNGVEIVQDEDVYLPYLTDSVSVLVATTDAKATFSIQGSTDLVSGTNLLSINVTAENGQTETFTANLIVGFNSDTSLATFQVADQDVVDGSVVNVAALVSEVDVLVETTDLDATYTVEGDTNLQPGENLITVTVIAADGETEGEYFVTVNVALNNDASIQSILVNGQALEDGDELFLDWATIEVEVEVTTTDENATYEVSGNTNLSVGENQLIVVVTAADAETRTTVFFNLIREPNTDTSLSSFQVNGSDVENGGSIEVPPLTTEVDVTAVTTDPDAFVVITGNTDLVTGVNELIVSVVAADGITSYDHVVTVIVPLNNDTSISAVQVDGEAASPGDTVEVPAFTDGVDVVVETTDPEATYEISGETGLVAGENTLTIIVTAADGTTVEEFSLTVKVLGDASLSVFEINGSNVQSGDELILESGTTDIELIVESLDPLAEVDIAGDSGLVTGNNTLVVRVTASDGETVAEYTISLYVLPSSDTSLSVFQVNGVDVEDGDTVELAPGSTDVELVIETTNPAASYEVSGDDGLFVGTNELVVTVTAENGQTRDFVVLLNVPANNDASVASITVNGEVVSADDILELDNGTTD